jgi:hypothetical protein
MMTNSKLFADLFTQAEAQVASAFSHLPVMDEHDWKELGALEDEINRLWTADQATYAEFREAVGKYKIWWFKKREVKK